MTDRLPPLTALRAFEAAARHLSFARAAAELNVTPAALSFQIKSLEEHLGQPVFRRLNRAVELTEAGRVLQPGTQDGFDALQRAWNSTRRLANTTVLNVTSGPAFTAKWLAPRMFDFAQKHPEIELRFSASLRLMDFERDEIDVAIRFGSGDDATLYSRALIEDWITPMAAPAIAETLSAPQDLSTATLLYQDLYPYGPQSIDWPAWFAAAKMPPPPKGGPRFSQADHAHDAAIAGSGVVLGRYTLAERALRDGQLVAPFRLALQLPYRCRFVCPKGAETRPHIAAFENWMLAEVKKMNSYRENHDFIAVEEPKA